MLLEEVVRMGEVVSWPQAVVTVAMILAGIAVPLARAMKSSHAAMRSAEATQKSVTENNGGESVKDYLQRIERTQETHSDMLRGLSARVSVVEERQVHPPTE